MDKIVANHDDYQALNFTEATSSVALVLALVLF